MDRKSPLIYLRSDLLICSKKLFHLLHCLVKLAYIRQINNAEVIRLLPVEALTRNNKHLFLMKKIQSKLFIIENIKFLSIDLREYIKCLAKLS